MQKDKIIAIEQLIINCIFEKPELSLKIHESDFISGSGREIYKIIDSLYSQSIEITIEHILSNIQNTQIQIDRTMLENLRTQQYTITMFSIYVENLKSERAKINIRDNILPDIAKLSTLKEDLDIKRLKELQLMLDKNIEYVEKKDKEIYNFSEWADACEYDLRLRESGEGFYDTGCSYLNNVLVRGFSPGDLTILFGSSGSGKSAFALWLQNRMINKFIPSVFVSTEMSKESQFDRLMAMRCHIDVSKLYPKNINDFDSSIFSIIAQQRQILDNHLYFRFVENPDLDLSDLKDIIIRCQKEMKVKYMVVFVDLLTMLKDFEGENKASKSEDAINRVLKLAKITGTHIFGVVQAKRPPVKVKINDIGDIYKNFQPSLEMIKNSSEFEARARNIFSVFRPYHFAKNYLKGDPCFDLLEDVAIIDNPKQNTGDVGIRSYYKYEAKYTNFIPYPSFDEKSFFV